MVFTYFRNSRRRKLLAAPFPEAWLRTLHENVGHYALLPSDQQARLRDKLRILVTELRWEGCQGLKVTEAMQVTIAAQAALLLLGDDDYYFDRIPSVLLYPGTFVTGKQPSAPSGVPVDEDPAALLGQAWNRGNIILSWPSALEGGRNPRDGRNVVLHELAHHLDGLDGDMGGSPPMPSHQLDAWHAITLAARNQLIAELEAGLPTPLDPYGLTNNAEFFAVATECFFERPLVLRQQYAPLYQALREFYRIDPAVWFLPPAERVSVAAHTHLSHRKPTGNLATSASEPHYRNGHTDQAITEAASRTEAPVFDLPPLTTPDRYFARGLEAYDEGAFEQAESDFDRTVRLRPDDQEALIYRALCRLILEHDEAALADAERACRLDPEDQFALRTRGMCRVAVADFEAGLQDLNQADQQEALDADPLFYRGLAYAELHDYRQALADFDKVIELDPQDAEAFRERSRCHELLGNPMSAERDLATAQRLEIEE